jgi:hypothetical protein
MRLTPVAVAATAGALALLGAASTSAQQTGASLELAGVPARLTVPGSFTITVSGSTGTTSPASIYPIYGPAPCAATVDAQLAASPGEVLLGPEADDVPAFGLAGAFVIHARGLGEAVSGPGLYTVCVFMEALEEPEAGEGSEEEEVIAVASATFAVLPSAAGVPHASVTRGGVSKCVAPRSRARRSRSARRTTGRARCSVLPRCVVPHITGRRRRSAENAIARAHCAVGEVKQAGSRHIRRGRVIWQSRRAGTLLPRGTRVGFLLSAGVSRRSPPIRACAGARHPRKRPGCAAKPRRR